MGLEQLSNTQGPYKPVSQKEGDILEHLAAVQKALCACPRGMFNGAVCRTVVKAGTATTIQILGRSYRLNISVVHGLTPLIGLGLLLMLLLGDKHKELMQTW